MITIDIIRHGAAEENQGPGNLYDADAGLSEEGSLQVEALVKAYIAEGTAFPVIFTSPLPRALATTQRLPSNGAHVILKGLGEPDWGSLVGRPFASFPTQPNNRGFDLYAETAGQEPFDDVVQRSRQAFDYIAHTVRPGEHVAVVSHGLISKLGMQALRDPDAPVPSAEADLPSEDQLGNAQAQRIFFDDSMHYLREERIAP